MVQALTNANEKDFAQAIYALGGNNWHKEYAARTNPLSPEPKEVVLGSVMRGAGITHEAMSSFLATKNPEAAAELCTTPTRQPYERSVNHLQAFANIEAGNYAGITGVNMEPPAQKQELDSHALQQAQQLAKGLVLAEGELTTGIKGKASNTTQHQK